MSKPICELVIEDMRNRDRIGRERYGVPLTANNGRDALQDAYEEALDLCAYLKQAIEERRKRADDTLPLSDALRAAANEIRTSPFMSAYHQSGDIANFLDARAAEMEADGG